MPTQHVIQKNEFFDPIASKYGLTRSQLQAANPHITNVDKIQAGASLTIPDNTPAAGGPLQVQQTNPNAPGYLAPPGAAGGSSYVPPANPNPDPTNDLRMKIQEMANSIAGKNVAETDFTTRTNPLEALTKSLTPTAPAPAAPNLVDTYNNAKVTQGVDTLENELVTVNNEMRLIQDEIASKKRTVRGKAISQEAINGRLYDIDQETADALDKLRSKKQTTVETLNMKNASVETFMNLFKEDYSNAESRYQNEFSKNLQLVNLAKGLQDDEKQEQNVLVDNARATLQMITNSFKDAKNVTFTPELEAQLAQIEMKAGFPRGFVKSFVEAKPKSKILFHYKNKDGTTTVFYEDPKNAGQVGAVEVHGSAATTQPSGDPTSTPEHNSTPPKDDSSKTLAAFGKDLTNRSDLDRAGTREQFIRQLQARYPNIEPDDIAKKVYETYPNGYDSKSGRQL